MTHVRPAWSPITTHVFLILTSVLGNISLHLGRTLWSKWWLIYLTIFILNNYIFWCWCRDEKWLPYDNLFDRDSFFDVEKWPPFVAKSDHFVEKKTQRLVFCMSYLKIMTPAEIWTHCLSRVIYFNGYDMGCQSIIYPKLSFLLLFHFALCQGLKIIVFIPHANYFSHLMK
jgi:hypothetical protein